MNSLISFLIEGKFKFGYHPDCNRPERMSKQESAFGSKEDSEKKDEDLKSEPNSIKPN